MSSQIKQHRGIAREGYTECTDDDCWCHDPAQNPQHEAHAKKAIIENNLDRPFQLRVVNWMMETFSMEVCRDRRERNHRFLEESLELGQARGCTAAEAHMLVDYVYSRPVGDPEQEVGGVMVTLAALCAADDVSMVDLGNRELARCWQNIDKIRAKQARKPKNSPLPGASEPSTSKDRMRAIRKTVEHFAHQFRQNGGAAPGAIQDLFDAAAALQTLEGAGHAKHEYVDCPKGTGCQDCHGFVDITRQEPKREKVNPSTLGVTHIFDGEEVVTGGDYGQVWIATFADPSATEIPHASAALKDFMAELGEIMSMEDGATPDSYLQRAREIRQWCYDHQTPLDFVESLKIADSALEGYKTDHPRMWNRVDGTPIPNDISVRMAQAFCAHYRPVVGTIFPAKPKIFILFFEDRDRLPEVFSGEGAERGAYKRWDQAKTSWACHLFARIECKPALPDDMGKDWAILTCNKHGRLYTKWVGCSMCKAEQK